MPSAFNGRTFPLPRLRPSLGITMLWPLLAPSPRAHESAGRDEQAASGAASASPIAKGLYPAPAQLADEGVEDDPDGASYWKIKHGIRLTGMPAWGHSLNDRQIWTLALFLKHMDKLPPSAKQAWAHVKN